MPIKVGIIGFGCVGTGVVKTLLENKELIASRLGNTIEIAKICDLDTSSDRGTGIDTSLMTSDVEEVISNPEIKIVVELIGGINPAKEFILKALRNGKHVVTANKKLLAENEGKELFQFAQENNLTLNFEAAVGGAIPIIRTIKESFASEKIEEVYGILNGTTNYIMSKLEKGGFSFEDVLKEAQKAGFAESDPTADVEGFDAAHKIKLIAQIAFGIDFNYDSIYIKGISQLIETDFAFAKDMGYKIKLLAFAVNHNGNFDVRVEPVLLKKKTELANIKGVTNAVLIRGTGMKEVLLTGPGAGEMPTASAIVGDIIEISRNLIIEKKANIPVLGYQTGKIKKVDLSKLKTLESKYYVRVEVGDQPGVLSQMSQVFADLNISINAVVQNPTTANVIPVMLTVHPTSREKISLAATKMNKLPFIKGKMFMMPIEDEIETGEE